MAIYVTMTDPFLSGWGAATGKKNKLVFVCANWTEAHTVANNARARGDMKSITTMEKKPWYDESQYYVQYKTKKDYPLWYEEGYFNKNQNT